MAKQLAETKRTLVHEDLNGFDVPLQTINKVISLANDIAGKYEELNIGPFTYDVFSDIIENDTLNIRVNYLAVIRLEIRRLNINNPSIQHAMLGDIDRALDPLKKAVSDFKNYSSNRMGYFSLDIRYKKASFENSRFILTEGDIERLKDEYCRIYIDDEKQSTALESLKSFVAAYNELLSSVSNMNQAMSANMIRNPLTVWDYIQIENQKASVYNPNLAYFLQTTH